MIIDVELHYKSIKWSCSRAVAYGRACYFTNPFMVHTLMRTALKEEYAENIAWSEDKSHHVVATIRRHQ